MEGTLQTPRSGAKKKPEWGADRPGGKPVHAALHSGVGEYTGSKAMIKGVTEKKRPVIVAFLADAGTPVERRFHGSDRSGSLSTCREPCEGRSAQPRE